MQNRSTFRVGAVLVACMLVERVALCACVFAQPPPGMGSSPPIGPSYGSAPVVVPPTYGETRLAPSPYLAPYTPSPTPSPSGSPSPYGTSSPYGNASGTSPWASPAVLTPARYSSAGTAVAPPATAAYDPRLFAEYEKLPRRGPYVALIVFGSIAILSGFPTLLSELRYSGPRDSGSIAYGAALTGLGALAIGVSIVKLRVRQRGVARLRAQGFQVALAPSAIPGTIAPRVALVF